MKHRRAASSALIAVGVVTLAACAPSESLTGDDLTPVTIAMTGPSCLNYFPFYVADANGYFAEQGLDVTIQALDGSSSVIQAMFAGQAEFGTPGPGPGILARDRGEDLVFTYNLLPRQAFNLVAPSSAGIESAEDLVGKTVGVATVDGTEVGLLETIMIEAGASEGDYTILPVGDGGLGAASLIREEISAYIGNPADIATIRATLEEDVVNLTPASVLAQFANGLATTGDFLADSPDVVEGFGVALAQATAWALDGNKEGVLDVCAAENPEESADPDYAEAVFETASELVTPLPGSEGYGYFPADGWAIWIDNLVTAGSLAEGWDGVEEVYTNEFATAYNE